jgi:hypothetical protein
MQPKWQKYYDWTVIIASRGIGSIIMSALIIIKRSALPFDEFGSIGHALATAMVVVAPFISPIVMLVSRRIIQTGDLSRDRTILLCWAITVMLASAGMALFEYLNPRSDSDLVFMIAIIAFNLVTSLNSMYAIWLHESGQSRKSVLFIAVLIMIVPLTVILREVLGIGQRDRSFSVETALLGLPVLIDLLRTRRSQQNAPIDIYAFSASNYMKYFVIVLFSNGILWVDWNLGRYFLAEPTYLIWAEHRIVLERILLPALNVIQAMTVWRLLRATIGPNRAESDRVDPRSVNHFFLLIAVLALLAALGWSLISSAQYMQFVPFTIGYLAFGMTAIFLEFFQVKFSILRVSITLLLIAFCRTAFVALILKYNGILGYSLVWALTSLLILSYIFRVSWSQIRLRKRGW